jgi:O-antigen ligase/tetratricopeptide (TPR) repeat protein
MGRRSTAPRTVATPALVRADVSRLGQLAGGLAEACVLVALVVTPLYFNPQSERVFEPDKVAWVIGLAFIALLALAVRGLEALPGRATPTDARGSSRWRRIARHPIVVIALCTGLALLFGAAGSAVPVVSLWGNYRRALGLLAWLAFLVLFLATTTTLRSPGAFQRVRRAVLVAALPLSLYAILQRFGIDSVPWQVAGDQPAERAFGATGNPILLGAFLVMAVPLALGGLGEAWPQWRAHRAGAAARVAGYVLVLVLGGGALWASQSRGPVVGLAAGLGLCAVLAAAASGRRRVAAALLVVSLGGSLALVGASRAALPGLGRLGGLLDPASRTAQERVLVWDAMADLVASDPARALRGYGPDSLMYVLPAHLPEALVRLTGDQTYDRAHNILWEWWLAGGLPGALALLALYVSAFAVGFWKLGLLPSRRALVGAMICLLAGVALGMGLPLLIGAAPYAALGAPVGLVAGAAVYAAGAAFLRSPSAVDGAAGGALGLAALVGLLGALAAHLVEGALGLPTVSAELLFWVLLGVLAAMAWPWEEERTGPAWTDGLVDGLALAALANAPLLLPRPPIRSTAAGWPLALLPLVVWVGADLLSTTERGAAYGQRAGARLAVLGAYVALFVVLASAVSGGLLAFALVLLGTTLALAWCLRQPLQAGPPTESWRWLVYGSLALLVAVAVGRLALAPVRADAWLRAGREAASTGDRASAEQRFDRAAQIWPGQPGFATYIGSYWRDVAFDAALGPAERVRAYSRAETALRGGLALAPDDDLALRLANLYRDQASVLPEGPERAALRAKAGEAYAQAQQIFPRSPSVLAEQALFFEQSGRREEAGLQYALVAELEPANLAARAGLARVAVARGDLDAALFALSAALATRPEGSAELARALEAGSVDPLADPLVGRAKAVLAAAAGDLPGARAQLDALRSTQPGEPALDSLAAWLAERGGG